MKYRKSIILLIIVLIFCSIIPIKAQAMETEQNNTINITSVKMLEVIANIKTFGKNLKDEKIVCIGDSITKGVGAFKKTEDDNYYGFTEYLKEKSDAEVVNLGIGGSPIGDYWNQTSIVLRMDEIPEDATKVIFWAGINDFFIGKENVEQYKEDTLKCFEYLNENFNNKDVYIVTTYKNGMEYWDEFKDNDLSFYMNYQIELAKKYDFNIIDFYNDNILNQTLSENKEYFYDDVHPNDDGYEFIAKYLFWQLTE